MPHGPNTFLPPIIDPTTGEEKQFLYEPQVHVAQNMLGRVKQPKYGTAELTDLLIKQYPPLFHAATNVPAFVATFSELVNLVHLNISCPGFEHAPRHRRSAVDYALISIRIAVERAPVYSLHKLSLLPIHPGGLLYLHPMLGFGSTHSSAKRWGQIRQLAICMESIPFPSSPSPRRHTQALEHLRILHAYLRTLSRGLTNLFFRWKGERGPSPLSLDKEPCMLPIEDECVHPSMRGETRGPRPLNFSRLRYMELENAVMDSSQIADFIHTHRRTLVEFNFEDVKLRHGNWDDALEPLTNMSGSESWKTKAEEVMDVPVMLSPVDVFLEPRVMGPLLDEVDMAIEEVSGNVRRGLTLSKWLGKVKSPDMKRSTKDRSWGGGDHMKKFLRGSMFSSWK
ncbi:hypothetical protein K504DRAFT_458669 [Pleomassaria siparia CBS 279.74]|uniref:Uncharacterized protein n=1 Tax=Pleomassaria siparia CBS 279.74 TaxID=1314801 RepID=A0A6G1K4C2_9PLEO|nr:hypothetical protein K504DRAFT_458669 [Pleomassaria siparia CBS 279.74]